MSFMTFEKDSISKIKIGLMWSIVILTVLIPGCIFDDDEDTSKTPVITIVDDLGNSVDIYEWPERIVSLSAGATEILFELNIGDKVVGRDSGSNYPAETSNIEEVFDPWTRLNDEKFVATNPDLVILHDNLDESLETRKAITDLGYTLIILKPVTVKDVIDNVELLGKVTDTNEEAKIIKDSMQKTIDDVELKVSQNGTNKTINVLYVVGVGYEDDERTKLYDPWVGGIKTYIDDIITTSGGTNVMSKIEEYESINLETLVDSNPDIILCSQDKDWPTESRSIILSESIFSSINAVENGHVYDIEANLVDRPGPRIVGGLEAVQEIISGI